MLKGKVKDARKIGKDLTTRYADHAWCISIDEAKDIGLVVEELVGDELAIVWRIHNLNREKQDVLRESESAKVMDQLKEIDPELIRGSEAEDTAGGEGKGDATRPTRYRRQE